MTNSVQLSSANQAHEKSYWERFSVGICRLTDSKIKVLEVMHYEDLNHEEAGRLAESLESTDPLPHGLTYEILLPDNSGKLAGVSVAPPVQSALLNEIDARWAAIKKADDKRFIESFKRRVDRGIEFVSIAECERFRALC